jgi:6-phosphofructokinase 2
MPASFLGEVGQVARAAGARYVLDTSGYALRKAGGVYLAKPSLRELRELIGRDLATGRKQVVAARELIHESPAQVVVVALGAEGAVLVEANEHERFAPIDVPVNSAVGAAEGMVAAITLAPVRGLRLRDAVRNGMAAGAAALMRSGTELCSGEDV